MELHRLLANEAPCPADVVLGGGDGPLPRGGFAIADLERRHQCHGARLLTHCKDIDHAMLEHLKLPNGFAELLARSQVFERRFVERGHDADGLGADGCRAVIDDRLDNRQGLIARAEQRIAADADIRQAKLRRTLAVHRRIIAAGQPGGVSLHEKQADAFFVVPGAAGACRNNDRIGGLIFSAVDHIEIKPRRGKTAVLDFISRCTKHSAWRPEQSTSKLIADKSSSVSRLRTVTHPGSLIFMISDFRDMNEKTFSHIANMSRNNDIIMIKISDPIEINLPTSGSYKLTDGLKVLQIQTSSKKTRSEYHQRYVDHNEQLERFCRQHRIHLVNISTDDDIIDKLKKGLGINSSTKTQFRSAPQNI